MRLREFLTSMALMFLTAVSGIARPLPDTNSVPNQLSPEAANDSNDPNESTPNILSPAVLYRLLKEDKVLVSAYYDTASILHASNPCSDFFGGPDSVAVLNRLIVSVRKTYLSPTIGMRMSGESRNVVNGETKKAFRLFDNVSINTNGPFYKRKSIDRMPTIPGVGSFQPNSREVRALILLHELGHLMKGPGGNWLLPDDGNDESLSKLNSRKIESICGDRIRNLGEIEARVDLAKQKEAEERLALVPKTSGP